jgi:hypothetical protein
MTDRRPAPGDIDIATPNVARIYDYLLGGKDNFAADREAARQLIAATPDMAGVVRDNRAFLRRAVRYLAGEAGVRQFLDLGTGLPTQTNVHQMAQEIAPDTRVVYVDNDPVVWSHGLALLASDDRVAMVHADLREPAEVLHYPDVVGLLDLTQPVALLCASVLHFVADAEEPHRIVAEYRDHVAPGSYLVVSHGPVVSAEEDPTGIVGSVTSVYRQASAQLHVRPRPEIVRFFDGFELIEPGVVWITEWRPDPGIPAEGPPRSLLGGVGRKR